MNPVERTAAAREASAIARQAAAAVHRAVADETIGIVALLTDDTPAVVEMRSVIRRAYVQRVLRAVPGVGAATTVRVCRAADVERLTRLGSLSAARRRVLAEALTSMVDLERYDGRGPRRRAGEGQRG